jgi:SAM-dependent methyltransferase
VRAKLVVSRIRREFSAKSLSEAFASIYERELWGGPNEPASGSGSVEEHARRYAAIVAGVIENEGVMRVVDLGCGDFSVGRLVAQLGIDYTGVDIVRALVDRNNASYGSGRVRFVHKNLAADYLPTADLALLRQVLQHLANAEIMEVLSRCHHYPLVLVTEHIPTGSQWRPNVDKPHGPDIRLYDRSGVLLEAPPFSIPVREVAVEKAGRLGGLLRSVLFRGSDIPSFAGR